MAPSFSRAPTAKRVPSALRATEKPLLSFLPSPSISANSCSQAAAFHSYTRAWPELLPLSPLLRIAPTAKRVPSAFSDTEQPNLSFVAAPSTLAPSCNQSVPSHKNTRAWPESAPLAPSCFRAPTASFVPSALSATARPLSSPTATPSSAAPSCTQPVPSHSYTRTWPELAPLTPWCFGAPTAKRMPLALSATA